MKNCMLLTWIKNISMGLMQHLRDAWASWGCAVVLGLAACHAAATQPSSEAVPRPSCDTLADALSRVKCRGVLRVGLRDGYEPFSRWNEETVLLLSYRALARGS